MVEVVQSSLAGVLDLTRNHIGYARKPISIMPINRRGSFTALPSQVFLPIDSTMRWCLFETTVVLVSFVQASSSVNERCFLDNFRFGSVSASYQVEGAVKETNRTSSICCREKGVAGANVADDFLHCLQLR